jgi:hypothetical protein
MSQDRLHNNFVLDFIQQVFCDVWVENFLDSNWCAIQKTFMNSREPTLSYLLTKLYVFLWYFSNTWNQRQSTCSDRYLWTLSSELWKVWLLNLLFQTFNLKSKSILLFSFLFKFLLYFSYFSILLGCSSWSLQWSTSSKVHPVGSSTATTLSLHSVWITSRIWVLIVVSAVCNSWSLLFKCDVFCL